MSQERIIYKGKFKGYYTAKKFDFTSGPRSYKIDWDKLILSDLEEIEDYNSDDLKSGIFSYLRSTKNFLIENGISVYKNELQDVFLKDFKIHKSIQNGDEFFVIVEGDFYGKTVVKPLPKENIKPKNIESLTNINDSISANEKINQVSVEQPDVNLSSSLSSSSSSSGCLSFITTYVGVLFFLFVLSTFKSPIAIFLGILMSLFIFGFGKIRLFRNSFFQIFGIILLFVVAGTLIFEYNSTNNEHRSNSNIKDDDLHIEDKIEIEKVDRTEIKPTKTLEYYSNNHNWKNYLGRSFNGTFKVRKDYFSSSKNYREYGMFYDLEKDYTLTEEKLKNFVFASKTLYAYTLKNEINKLPEVLKLYDDFKKQRYFSNRQFAELVVTSIQSIPYVLICQDDCRTCKKREGYKGKCLGDVLLGFQTPVEFMANFKGDCDTRVLLCFYILKKFGYDVAILISERYRHAVLGINLNVAGSDYVFHKGVKYYAWETTAKGFKPGYLSREDKKMKYWSVCLTSREINL